MSDIQEITPLLKFKLKQLLEEIDRSQMRIAHYDDLNFKIKGWAVTLWVGTFAFGFKQGSAIIILAAIPALVAFWFVEALFRKYQYRHVMRTRYIESFINRGPDCKGYSLEKAFAQGEISSEFILFDPICRIACERDVAFKKKFDTFVSIRRCLWLRSVFFFYGLLAVVSTLAALIVPFIHVATNGSA